MNYTTATVTIPAGTYYVDGLSIMLGVPDQEVDRLMGMAAREGLAHAVVDGWRLPWPLEVDVAHPWCPNENPSRH